MEDGESGFWVERGYTVVSSKPHLYGEDYDDSEQDDLGNKSIGNENDEAQILALHEAGDRALMNADLAVLAQIFADDYVQYNEAGKAVHQAGCAEKFSDGGDPLSVDCFDRAENSRLRRYGGRARLGIRRSRSRRKEIQPCATFTLTYCGNAMASGNWWRRSWRGRWKNDTTAFPCVPLRPLWFEKGHYHRGHKVHEEN